MLKFTKSVPYIPDPARSRPFISEENKEKAKTDPPHAVPFHCKPWVDGQTVGWTLFYGFMTPVTIRGRGEGKFEVDNLPQLARETNQPHIIDHFADGHFGLGSGYTLQTPPGIVSMLLPATHPPPGLEVVTGVIETDWYPRQLFLVFRVPPAGVEIALDYKNEVARVVLIVRPEALKATPLNAEELKAMQERKAAYLEEEKNTPTAWTAVSGRSFTRLYKVWSVRYRGQKND